MSLAGRGIRLVLSGDRVELATAPEAGALIARYVGADAVRLSPAALETLAIVAYRQPVTKGGDRADPRRGLRLHASARCCTGAWSWSSAAPRRPAARSCTAPGFEFLERFGLTSLDDLPPLDLDVAARLVDGPTDGDPASDLAGIGRTPAAPAVDAEGA